MYTDLKVNFWYLEHFVNLKATYLIFFVEESVIIFH